MLVNKTIDFIPILPLEVSSSIFDKLILQTKTDCLYLSKQWHQSLVSHPATWSTLYIDDNDDNEIVIQRITNILPSIAQHVRHLTLSTKHPYISQKFIVAMQKGYFINMKSMRVDGKSIRNLESSDYVVSPEILLKMGHTLTFLDLDLQHADFNIKDLLCGLPHLITLKFKANSGAPTMDNNNTTELSSSYNLSTMNHPLKDLALEVRSLQGTSTNAEVLIRQCHQLQRLVLNNCWDDYPSEFLEKFCPDLKILAYNYDDVDVDKLDNNNEKHNKKHRGLRKIYVSQSASFFQPNFRYILQLIHTNKATLEVIDIGDTLTLEDPPFDQFGQQPRHHPANINTEDIQEDTGYLELMNLKSLAIRYDKGHPIAALLFQSIPFYPALTTLKVPKGQNTHRIVDQLITSFEQPLQKLNFDITLEDEREDIADMCLQRLFKHYAALASSPAPQPSPLPITSTLEAIHLKDSCGILTDNTLYTLSNIPTIRDFGLDSGSPNITVQGLYTFFKRRAKTLTHVSLTRLLYIRDADLIAFADLLTHVTHMKMEHLFCVFDHGIFSLIQKAVCLKTLIINDCPVASSQDAVISFAKSKRIENIKICVKHCPNYLVDQYFSQ
ncbi:hypothetical protein BDA99DRAFT_526088 [Phascolomyces articulosus]|uniref:F-box domain-containing protein n=1 Tax=Phascolomyces articulosus TaxID=60185 RepID=A0AAD5JPI8_9FUNG|nr:hypothetical protein BDA99DRAFT_526088 [Phascolomyces articulosus]